MKKKVTIQDIADALNISRNTVSKAINNSEGLAEATRDRILKKAVEMGYKHFSYVNTMTAIEPPAHSEPEKPYLAGEVALFSTTTYFGQSHFATLVLDKVHQELSQLGYTLTAHRVDKTNIQQMTLPMTFLRERCSAIVCVEVFDRKYADLICSLGLPVLFLDSPAYLGGSPLAADVVCMENTCGITCAVQELIRRGIKRFGFIGDHTHCQSFLERYLAFRNALMFAGMPIEEKFLLSTNCGPALEQAVTALDEMPEVFICANDFVAVDSIPVLQKLGIKVPDDVMLVGFDDSPESCIFSPTLTTVHIHTQSMAYSAVHMLISRIKTPDLEYRTTHTHTDLIWRQSTKD